MSWRKVFLPLAFLAAPVLADVHPNTAPGFPVDQSFHVGDVDSVNLFNGALTLTIPIGTSYPVNGGFSYSLKLTYNSSPWLFKTVRYLIPPDFHEVSRTQAYPNPCSNAGLGWRVSFGRLNPLCQVPDEFNQPPLDPVYQDENGTDHLFYPTLHAGDAEDAPVSGVYDVQYTRDGSYLRLKKYTAGYREIEFPDGSVRKFGNDGLPTEIRDSFNNKLSISYAIADQWVLTDTQGRTHRIHFRTDLASYSQVIDRIELMTFGGVTTPYQFSYTSRTIGRACPHNDTDQMNSIGPTVSVPLLTGVTLADGSSWAAAVSDYVTTIPSGPTWSENACTENGGNLTGLTLPTRGRMEWSWQRIVFPTGSTARLHLRTSSGVATRMMRNADGTVQGTWTYAHAPGFPAALSSREHTTTVVDPLGHRTVNYFSTAADPNFTGWSAYEYSLPFTHDQTVNASGTTLNLSRQTYDGPTLLRSEYVLYERDPIFSSDPPDSYNTNRRMVRGRTVYNDDGNPNIYAGVVSSGFDGLGHYRTQTTEGNFDAGNVRTHFANYNLAQGTYAVNPVTNTGAGYSLFPAGSPWVLEAPSSMSDSEGSATAQVDLCYAPDTPAVTRKRVHRLGAAPSTNDLLTVYDLETLPPPDSRVSGNVASEKSYGGDFLGHGIGTSALCTMTLPASPEIQIDHTYVSGVRKISKYTSSTPSGGSTRS
ncbi:MAG TPA: hypothetical protein VLB76_09320 [Thermoanaerobaculia bacterium]|jgi:hypothetical protein|nr:hypothetical protein [Thermoanaerobaculia bacterium]